MTGAGIFGTIVSKLRLKKKPYLIILFKVYKNLKISFHRAILPLSLAICLQIEGNEEFLLDA